MKRNTSAKYLLLIILLVISGCFAIEQYWDGICPHTSQVVYLESTVKNEWFHVCLNGEVFTFYCDHGKVFNPQEKKCVLSLEDITTTKPLLNSKDQKWLNGLFQDWLSDVKSLGNGRSQAVLIQAIVQETYELPDEEDERFNEIIPETVDESNSERINSEENWESVINDWTNDDAFDLSEENSEEEETNDDSQFQDSYSSQSNNSDEDDYYIPYFIDEDNDEDIRSETNDDNFGDKDIVNSEMDNPIVATDETPIFLSDENDAIVPLYNKVWFYNDTDTNIRRNLAQMTNVVRFLQFWT